MKIIRQRRVISRVFYSRAFSIEDIPGAGYGFPCDASGTIFPSTNVLAKKNLAACLAGEVDGHKVIDNGVRTYRDTYTEQALGRCECGRDVELGHFTCPCPCGRDYNWAGQRLAPRSQWGEETGECLADILRIQ